jgi:hypothetical protein
MVLSAAADNVIDECQFIDIDAHGDVALISWDGMFLLRVGVTVHCQRLTCVCR